MHLHLLVSSADRDPELIPCTSTAKARFAASRLPEERTAVAIVKTEYAPDPEQIGVEELRAAGFDVPDRADVRLVSVIESLHPMFGAVDLGWRNDVGEEERLMIVSIAERALVAAATAEVGRGRRPAATSPDQ